MRLLPLPFDSVFVTSKRPISEVVRTCVPIGLLVEADDVDDTDLLDRLGDQRDLRPNEVLVHHRRLSREELHLDGTGRGDLDVH